MNDYLESIIGHYEGFWANTGTPVHWDEGPRGDLPSTFTVLEFPPSAQRSMWIYATACMSLPADQDPLELHLFSPQQYRGHVELLTAVAHYHRTGARLGLGHTVDFGRPWLPGSRCDHGLISLPYLDGPALELFEVGEVMVRFLWLVPVTKEEVEYKKARGLEELEAAFEAQEFNYLDPLRDSVV